FKQDQVRYAAHSLYECDLRPVDTKDRRHCDGAAGIVRPIGCGNGASACGGFVDLVVSNDARLGGRSEQPGIKGHIIARTTRSAVDAKGEFGRKLAGADGRSRTEVHAPVAMRVSAPPRPEVGLSPRGRSCIGRYPPPNLLDPIARLRFYRRAGLRW